MRRNVPVNNLVYALLISIMILGCDSSSNVPDTDLGEPLPFLDVDNSGLVSNGNVQIELQDNGGFLRGRWNGDFPPTSTNNLYGFSFGGIWIASESAPMRATATGLFPSPLSDLEFWNTTPDSSQFFLINELIDEKRYINWPTWLGAPSHDDGSLKRYGSSMAWASFRPRLQNSNIEALDGIRIGISTFVTDATEFQDAIFLRYDVANVGLNGAIKLLTGHFSDLDVSPSDPVRSACGLSNRANQAGFDESRGLAFVYFSPDSIDGNIDPSCYGYAVGIGFLDLSKGGVPTGIYSNRIVTRGGGDGYYPQFSEATFNSAEDINKALLGLASDGSPMINPTTSGESRFAFTGDPVSRIGWIDQRNDSRQLMSKSAVTLDMGETKSMIAVVLKGEGSNNAEAIKSLKSKYDLVKQTSSLWDY